MRRPPRFVIASASVSEGQARVDGAELHHMRDVMRLEAGAEVALLVEMLEGLVGKILAPAEVNACQRHSFKMLEGLVGKIASTR